MEAKKVVLITGAMSDIGQATAKVFALAGYCVVLNYRRNPEEVVRLSESLMQTSGAGRVIAVQADIRSRDEVRAMFDEIYNQFGRLDVLVNNAGINRDRPFLEMSDEDMELVFATIVKGTFICSQEFAQRYEGSKGSIINFGSTTAVTGRKNGANYCPARAAVLTLTKCMALELAPNIRVNTVTPGRIDTTEVRERYHTDDAQVRERFEQDVPLKRMGTPQEIASMIFYLAEKADYITGQNFLVDGGLMMR